MEEKDIIINDEEQVFIPEKKDYELELLNIIRSDCSNSTIKEQLADYHDSDVASIIPKLTIEERRKLYKIIGDDALSDIFAYLEDVEEYIAELDNEKVADIIEFMDADDAVDVLEELPEEQKQQILELMDEDAKEDIELIDSYDDNMIGSRMTTNFIAVKNTFTVKEATKAVINQASDNDNLMTIYVVDNENKFYGAIELRDLIRARDTTPLEDIITTNYPYLYARENTSECITALKEYNEDSIPVLNRFNELIGVITSFDIVEAVDEDLGDDYAKLAGLTEEEDLEEPLFKSLKKRIPWLLILLGLGMVVASVIQSFQKLIPPTLIILYTFQSLILGMSGNAGTQSLGVTIRLLGNEALTFKEKLKFILKEARVSFCNGVIIGLLSFVFIGCYLQFIDKSFVTEFNVSGFIVSGCIGLSLLVAMIIAGLDGVLIPLLFKKIGIDPAVASGPLITTINDFVAVVAYYGISILMLVNVLGIA